MRSYQEETEQLYLDKTAEYGSDDVRALTWGSQYTQEVRFRQLPRLFDVKYALVLDVGCGRGDLYNWLGCQDGIYAFGSYIGIDLCEHHIRDAQKNNPGVEFLHGAVPDCVLPSADVVFASGLFGFNCSGPNEWTKVVESMIDAMWDVCRVGICFNMQSKWEVPPVIHYPLGRNWDPLYWLAYVSRKSKKVALLHDYLKGDFTIGVRRDV